VLIRGAESRFTAVFIDGVRIDTQSTGGASWNAIPLAQIDRIEVVRGPAGAIYGSDAIAGVVQIFTRRGEGPFTPSVEAGVGTYGTRRLGASARGTTGPVDYALGVAQESSRGFNSQPAGNPDIDGYRSTSASARLGWQLSADQRIEATALSNRLDTQYDETRSVVDDHAKTRLDAYGLAWNARWTPAWTTRLSVGQSIDRYETSPVAYRSETRINSYLFHNTWTQGPHQVTAALERREDRLDNASTLPASTSRAQTGLALGYGLSAGAHTVQLNARHDEDSEFGGHATGSAAWAWRFAEGWRTTASMGTAFRAPTLFQRFSLYGVPTLQPETSRNVELGLRYAQGPLQFGAALFRNDVSDLITFVSGPGACLNGTGAAGLAPAGGCYGNTARARYEGVSLSGAASLGPVRLRGSIDLQDPRDLDTDKQLARRAREMGRLSAELPMGAWTLGTEALGVGDSFNDAANKQRLPGYGLLNFFASRAIGQDWSLIARLDNAGDKAYQTVRGYASPGRAFWLGLSWSRH
jgi:vitamin B12 transporter